MIRLASIFGGTSIYWGLLWGKPDRKMKTTEDYNPKPFRLRGTKPYCCKTFYPTGLGEPFGKASAWKYCDYGIYFPHYLPYSSMSEMKLQKAWTMRRAETIAIDPVCQKLDLQKGRFVKRNWKRRLQRTEALPREQPIEAGFSSDKVKAWISSAWHRVLRT